MGKRKTLHVDLKKDGQVLFGTPVSSPDVVVGLMAALAVPQNYDCVITICVRDIEEIAIVNEEKDN